MKAFLLFLMQYYDLKVGEMLWMVKLRASKREHTVRADVNKHGNDDIIHQHEILAIRKDGIP